MGKTVVDKNEPFLFWCKEVVDAEFFFIVQTGDANIPSTYLVVGLIVFAQNMFWCKTKRVKK